MHIYCISYYMLTSRIANYHAPVQGHQRLYIPYLYPLALLLNSKHPAPCFCLKSFLIMAPCISSSVTCGCVKCGSLSSILFATQLLEELCILPVLRACFTKAALLCTLWIVQAVGGVTPLSCKCIVSFFLLLSWPLLVSALVCHCVMTHMLLVLVGLAHRLTSMQAYAICGSDQPTGGYEVQGSLSGDVVHSWWMMRCCLTATNIH